ncbi:MAG TPA: hypothetical protein PLX89_24645, partial [Verrucomicrobiota bacterium]|nr:hypothetical protein [Verrucomicrobiota bacterium]
MNLSLTPSRISLTAIAALSGIWLQPVAQAIELGFSSIPESQIVFTPLGDGTAKVDFTPTPLELYSFQIDVVHGGTGSAVGVYGDFISAFVVGSASVVS